MNKLKDTSMSGAVFFAVCRGKVGHCLNLKVLSCHAWLDTIGHLSCMNIKQVNHCGLNLKTNWSRFE